MQEVWDGLLVMNKKKRRLLTVVPEDCEGCVFLIFNPDTGRGKCDVFYEFLPDGWVREDGSCMAYRRRKSEAASQS